MRLDKFLALTGNGTRSQVKALIKKGLVEVDGKTASSPDMKIDETVQQVSVAGQAVVFASEHYYMLHKPAGVVSAVTDRQYRTVIDLLGDESRRDLFPVGRLDIDTEGLLLITDNGKLAHELLAPGNHIDKVYQAVVTGRVTQEDIQAFAEGMDIGEKRKTIPAKLVICQEKYETPVLSSDSEVSYTEVTIREGKFHQIKRMFASRGKEVIYLRRIQMGSLKLDPALSPGEFRPLSEQEIDDLKKHKDRKHEKDHR